METNQSNPSKYSVGQRFVFTEKFDPSQLKTFEILPREIKPGMVGTVKLVPEFGVIMEFTVSLSNGKNEWCFSEETIDLFFNPISEDLLDCVEDGE